MRFSFHFHKATASLFEVLTSEKYTLCTLSCLYMLSHYVRLCTSMYYFVLSTLMHVMSITFSMLFSVLVFILLTWRLGDAIVRPTAASRPGGFWLTVKWRSWAACEANILDLNLVKSSTVTESRLWKWQIWSTCLEHSDAVARLHL